MFSKNTKRHDQKVSVTQLAVLGDLMLQARSCHFVSDKRVLSLLLNDTVKCQDYTALDSTVREMLFSVLVLVFHSES